MNTNPYCVKMVFGAILCMMLVSLALVWLFAGNRLAHAAFMRGQYGLALLLDRSDAQLALDIGTQAFGYTSYDLPFAERAFRRAVAIDPRILWGHYDLAHVLFDEGRFAEARKELDAEVAANPGNLRTLYLRGLTDAYDGYLADAEDDFTRFTEWAPAEWAGYNDLAWVLAQEGKYADAKAALLRGFKNVTDAAENPWFWNNIGVQELNLGEYRSASGAFSKAKALAAGLTDEAWHKAYPGNDPAASADGIAAFRSAVEENLARAEKAAAL